MDYKVGDIVAIMGRKEVYGTVVKVYLDGDNHWVKMQYTGPNTAEPFFLKTGETFHCRFDQIMPSKNYKMIGLKFSHLAHDTVLTCLECGATSSNKNVQHLDRCGHHPDNDIVPPLSMTYHQRESLQNLAERFQVEFSSCRFHMATTCDGLPSDWVVGTVGPIYVGCDPLGTISS
jgi:hypothetical protein